MSSHGAVQPIPLIGKVARVASEAAPKPKRYGWHTADETLRVWIERFGVPKDVPDLSVDEVTGRRLLRSDYAGVVSLRERTLKVHDSLLELARNRLKGRDPDILVEDDEYDTISIYFQMEDDSHESAMRATTFGYALGYLSGATTRVWVNRYRDFPSESSEENERPLS